MFYLRGVAPAIVKTIDMYKGVIAFIVLQIIALLIVGLYPPLVNYLPNRVSFLSESAPPPRNPRLQYCIEEYTHEKFTQERAAIDAALTDARGLDFAVLPKSMASKVTDSFDKAEQAIKLLAQAKEAETVVTNATAAYRPTHTLVRDIQADIAKLDGEIEEIETRTSRLRGDNNSSRRERMVEQVKELKAEKAHLQSTIPDTWKATQKEFSDLTKAEAKLRSQFRRASDDSYSAIQDVIAIFDAQAAFEALGPQLRELRAKVAAAEPADVHEAVNEVSKQFNSIAGASKIKSPLSKARRDLKNKSPKKERALENIDKAIAEYDSQADWRKAASEGLSSGLAGYSGIARDTFGARLQPKLSREQALFVASCQSHHRDISLNF